MEDVEPLETEHGSHSHQILLENIRCIFAVGMESRCGIRFDTLFFACGKVQRAEEKTLGAIAKILALGSGL